MEVAIIVLLFLLAFAGHGLTQPSQGKDSASRDAATVSKPFVMFLTTVKRLPV
jgi:hypothetical protein